MIHKEMLHLNLQILVLVVQIFILTKPINVMIGNRLYFINHMKKLKVMDMIVRMMFFH